MRARRGPPPPPLAAWFTTTPPRAHGPIYFPEGLPLSPLSLPSRRRSRAPPHTPGRLSCRVHAEAGSRDSFLERNASSRLLRVSRILRIYLRVQRSGAVSLAVRRVPFSRGRAIVVVACTFGSRPAACNPFCARGCARVSYGTCVPRGPRPRIHLLPLLPSGIRRAGTTVSDEAVLRNCGVPLNFARSLFARLHFELNRAFH